MTMRKSQIQKDVSSKRENIPEVTVESNISTNTFDTDSLSKTEAELDRWS